MPQQAEPQGVTQLKRDYKPWIIAASGAVMAVCAVVTLVVQLLGGGVG
jgi:negative regulator of sigma E activity